MTRSRMTPERLHAEMYDFARNNRRFANGDVHGITVRVSETVDYKELALSALLSAAGEKSLNQRGETIDCEEELLIVDHSFSAYRAMDDGRATNTIFFSGYTSVKRDNIPLPRHLLQFEDDGEADDEQLGAHELASYYHVVRNPHSDEVEVDAGQRSIIYDEDDVVLVYAGSDKVEPIEARYSHVLIDDDDDDDVSVQPSHQYMSQDAQFRMNHEPVHLETAHELGQLLLLPDTFLDYEVERYLERQNFKIAVQSFRSLRRAQREQAGLSG